MDLILVFFNSTNEVAVHFYKKNFMQELLKSRISRFIQEYVQIKTDSIVHINLDSDGHTFTSGRGSGNQGPLPIRGSLNGRHHYGKEGNDSR